MRHIFLSPLATNHSPLPYYNNFRKHAVNVTTSPVIPAGYAPAANCVLNVPGFWHSTFHPFSAVAGPPIAMY